MTTPALHSTGELGVMAIKNGQLATFVDHRCCRGCDD
jgi:hypothetical protein